MSTKSTGSAAVGAHAVAQLKVHSQSMPGYPQSSQVESNRDCCVILISRRGGGGECYMREPALRPRPANLEGLSPYPGR